MRTTNSDTAIILVNWNRWNEIDRVLRLLLVRLDPSCEVIVVDNGSSTKPSFAWQNLARVKFIFLTKNLGPCHARNVGILAASREFVFFLDSDAILSRRALSVCVARMRSEPDLGLIGCRINRGFEHQLDQWIYVQARRLRQRQSFDTYSFSAAGALARRELLLQIGGFNEDLYIYNEEVDLSLRILKKGYRISYDSAARVYHFPCAAGSRSRSFYWRMMIRNWIWIFFRYYPPAEALRRASERSLIYLLKGIYAHSTLSILCGILEGFAGARRFANEDAKLSPELIAKIDRLNPRQEIIWGPKERRAFAKNRMPLSLRPETGRAPLRRA